MEAPLLNEFKKEDGDYLPVRSLKDIKSVFWEETVKMWELAGPVIITLLCQFGIISSIAMFVGHLGDLELSAVSISLTVIGTFSYGFLLGMGSAVETLCGQAFGAGQVHMLGIYLQRSWIILTVTGVILSPIYIFATPILKLLGQEDSIAKLSGEFSVSVLPQMFSFAINFPTQKFLQAQGKVGVLAWISFAALVIHVFLLWLFIIQFGWGLAGAAVVTNVSGWIISVAQVVYVFRWCKEGWHGFSWSAFSDMWAFVRLSLASAVMLCLEVWYMTSIVILTGHLDNSVVAVDSLSICMLMNNWENVLFIGINAAISVRVSNELGLGHAVATKYSVYVTVFQSLVIGLVFMVVVLFAKDYIAIFFTSSKIMQESVSKLAFLLSITMVLNSVQPVISGVAVGGGWQALVAYINIGCYYIFGIPLGFLLGYTANLGVAGIWSGMIAGTALQTLMLLLVLYKTNWKKEVEQSTERMKKWAGKDVTEFSSVDWK